MKLSKIYIVLLIIILAFSGVLWAQDSTEIADSTSMPTELIDLKPFKEKSWNSFNDEQERTAFFKDWSKKDSVKYEQKFQLEPDERMLLSKLYKELNAIEKLKYRKAERKIHKKQKKRFEADKKRFRKTVKWSKPDRNYSRAEIKNFEQEQKIRYLKARSIWQSRKEAYRKAKVIERFNRKENRLRQRYALDVEEKTVLNKALGMPLEQAEKKTYRTARRKQIKFSEKLIKLRKHRHIQLQNKDKRRELKREFRRDR